MYSLHLMGLEQDSLQLPVIVTMAAKVTLLSNFLKYLNLEDKETVPFTWLIGSKISEDLGIPSRQAISKKIILFEYILQEYRISGKKIVPWDSDSHVSLGYNVDDLCRFFDWYETSHSNQDEELDAIINQSIQWIHRYEIFQDIDLDSQECHRLIFQHFLHDATIRQCFLLSLTARAHRTSIAYAGLAGLLKDFPDWGHTVFTTAFDDYLLKAIFNIGGTAHTFSQYSDAHTEPFLFPACAQIVYHNGTYTNYRVAGTEDTSSSENLGFLGSFRAHTEISNLIVLGCSGRDSSIVKSIKAWKQGSSSHNKKLYWVPDGNEFSMTAEIRNLLESCIDDKVHIVVNDSLSLNADSFILELCSKLNVCGDGFEGYRRAVLHCAKKRHESILEQLAPYPNFNPYSAIDFLEEAKKSYRNGDIQAATQQKEIAKKLIAADDVPNTLKGKAFFESSVVEWLLGEEEEAENSLKKAHSTWSRLKNEYPDAEFESANAVRALGELHLRIGKVEDAKDTFKAALKDYSAISDRYGMVTTIRYLAEISLRESKLDKAKQHIDNGWPILERLIEDEDSIRVATIEASYNRISGDYHILTNSRQKAYGNYKSAQKIFEAIEDCLGVANVLKCLGDVCTRNLDFVGASKYLNQAKEKYESERHLLGLANVENALGDLNVQMARHDLALEHYRTSIDYHRQTNAKHGLANAIADYLKYLSNEQDAEEARSGTREELKSLVEICGNAYAKKLGSV